MVLLIRPRKEVAINATTSLAPQYTQLLRELQKGEGRLSFCPEVAAIQQHFGSYVSLYEDENKLGIALLVALLGEKTLRELNEELKQASPEEQQEFFDELIKSDEWFQWINSFELPDTPEGWAAARRAFVTLPEEEKEDVMKSGMGFWAFFFGQFFNVLSLMIHGEKLTALVQKAIAGDDSAFMRAVQTDRMLLLHHPYFRQRKLRAQEECDKAFLRRIASREATPILNGKIQFPGLYMVFGILESFQWLDDIKANEILDICARAGLDQHQNHIEDADYVSKRLREYRRWQKSLRMSRI